MTPETDPQGDIQPTVSVVAIPGCPHRELAEARARQALVDAGFAGVVDVVVVATAQEAGPAGFRGSPTVLINGRDHFPAPDSTSWACRLYRTEEGMEGSPSVSQLQEALQHALGE